MKRKDMDPEVMLARALMQDQRTGGRKAAVTAPGCWGNCTSGPNAGDPHYLVECVKFKHAVEKFACTLPGHKHARAVVGASSLDARFRARYEWVKVRAPIPWSPSAGEELLGFYGGRTLKKGRFGQYEVALIHVPERGSFTVSGTVLITLLDAAMISPGHPVRLVYGGKQPTGGVDAEGKPKEWKRWELFKAEGPPVPMSDLPTFLGYH